MRLEFLRRRPEVVKELDQKAEIDSSRWESAFLTSDRMFNEDLYITSLSLRDQPSSKIYAHIIASERRTEIDIPIMDSLPETKLVQEAYNEATFFGEVDQEAFREFACDRFTSKNLLAMLNRKTTGLPYDEMPDWFYSTFKVDHLKQYGQILIGSHGGSTEYGYDFNITFENRNRDKTYDKSASGVAQYVLEASNSLPQVDIVPVDINTYLNKVSSNLMFLPKDWEIN